MEWGQLATIVLLLAATVCVVLVTRHILLTRSMLPCAIQRNPDGSWERGYARLLHDRMEWYKPFQFVLTPQVTLYRNASDYLGHGAAHPEPAKSGLSSIMRVRGAGGRSLDVAVEPGAALGLMAWLESAPPGSHVLPSSTDSPL